MSYVVEIAPAVVRQLKRLPKRAQRQITNTIKQLGEEPRPPNVKKLKGDLDLYRVRSGDYRVIYLIRDEVLVVLVLRVGHRKDVYREV